MFNEGQIKQNIKKKYIYNQIVSDMDIAGEMISFKTFSF